MTNYNSLIKNLETLELNKIVELLPNVISESVKNNTPLVESLYRLTEEEIKFRDERAKRINITVSHFPFYRTIKQFDFAYQPSINRKEIEDLATLRFIQEKSNVIFIGSSGVGKTHLATALGIEAASQRISTYYINFAKLMEKIKVAAKENRLEQVIKHYLKYTLLIIDEVGYVPVDKDASFGFFQLIAARYENKPIVITTNQNFSKWSDVFGDVSITAAIVDRLVHHSTIIKINGTSYRIKGKRLYEEEDQ